MNPYAGLRKLPLEDLMRAEKDVQSLLDHPGWGFVHALLLTVQRDHSALVPGLIGKHAELAHKIGFLEGLKVAAEAPEGALAIAQAVVRNAQREADAAQERNGNG